ncbi:MAG: HAMP domain-containing histidine kinase [Clostridia bacterium]|nr:HAMP domain-containing histidine kinase [Clostridia bacterium]
MVGWMIFCAVLGLLAIVFLFLYLRVRIKLCRLVQSADDFLTGQAAPVPYSVSEDALAPVQNAISDLQSRIRLLEDMKKEAHASANNMISDISHQLKTPLASVRLFTEMDAGAHMDVSLTQIERMENLIQSLLKLERLCADGYAFTFEETNAFDIVMDAWNAVSPSYPGRKIEIVGNAAIRADQKWLSEAYMNLFKNSLEHMDEAGVVRVTLEKGENTFFSTVSDAGGGVLKEELTRIFDRFYRSKTRTGSGSGIGLSLTREIIRRHHGSIHAENIPGGLRMNLTLPILNLSKS